MQHQASAPTNGIVVAAGFGVKVHVEGGHLVVHDGIARTRETRRFNRATSRLERLTVIGHSGFVTLEALRWIRDIGAAFCQIGRDGEVIAISSAERLHNTKLRRAQAAAIETSVGLDAMRQLVVSKLERQASLASEYCELLPRLDQFGYRWKEPIPETIGRQLERARAATTLDELRGVESVAGRWYWRVLAHIPVRFESRWVVPDHWRLGGLRTSIPSGFKSARKATTPLHALVNYAYAVLETEATIVLQTYGFDPGLGILHTDKRYRGSLASDLMEPVRPTADELVLGLLKDRRLARGEVYETREGVCRLGPTLARELASGAPALRTALSPHAARLSGTLLGKKGGSAAAPGKRRNARAAGKGRKRTTTPRLD